MPKRIPPFQRKHYVGAKKKTQLLGEVAERHGGMSYLSAMSILNV